MSMKTRRLLIGVLVFSVVLFIVLAGGLLLSKVIGGQSTETAAVEPDLVIYPQEESAVDEADEAIADGEDQTEGHILENDTEEQEEPALESEVSDQTKKDAWIGEKLSAMTLEEKVCQLFMLSPEKLTGVSRVVAAGDVTKQAIQD